MTDHVKQLYESMGLKWEQFIPVSVYNELNRAFDGVPVERVEDEILDKE